MKWKHATVVLLVLLGLVFILKTFYDKSRTLDLKRFTQYAINFKVPDGRLNKDNQCKDLPSVSADLKSVLLHHKKNTLFKRNISLILLKYYNCDIKHFGVGYEVRKNLFFYHPIVDAYYATLKESGKTSFEFVPTTDVFEIINKEPALIKDNYILSTLQETCNIFEKRAICSDLPFDKKLCESHCL